MHAKTNDPAELYIVAAKYRGKGIGKKLIERSIKESKKLGFGELMVYSPNSHNESWPFYDKLGLERIGEITEPEDNEAGQAWRKIL